MLLGETITDIASLADCLPTECLLAEQTAGARRGLTTDVRTSKREKLQVFIVKLYGHVHRDLVD